MLRCNANHPAGFNPPPRQDARAEEADDALPPVATLTFQQARWRFLPFLPQRGTSEIFPDLPLG